MFSVIFTVGGLSPEHGGPSRSLPMLVEALARLGVQAELITCASSNDAPAPLLPPPNLVRSHLVPWSCRERQWLARPNGFFKLIRRLSGEANRANEKWQMEEGKRPGVSYLSPILHDTGLWLASNHAVAAAARRFGLPLIVSPRGMLTPWALKYRGLKKRIAWRLYQRADLQSARVLHATSQQEAQEFRALGLHQPIAVIPNGVEKPQPETLEAEILKSERAPARRTVLFLSRIHPKKGLLNLVEAWPGARKAVGACNGQWKVVIAGNDENGYQAELQSAIRLRGVETDFEFVGPVEGQAKWDLYRRADLFVLPSHSENFGLVVAEALACGVPVITTHGTPWEELQTRRCGWWVEVGAEPLAAALQEAMVLSDEERRQMGERARQLVESKYTWPRVAEQMKSVYEWMLSDGERPNCVVGAQ